MASKVPPGVNLKDDQGPQLRALLIAMLVLPTFAIIVRFWSRALLPSQPMSKRPTRFWWDDWTALIAACVNVAVCGVGLKLVDLGMGKHIEVVPPENLTPFLKLLWVEYYIFDAGTSIAKGSALLFYARVFNNTKSRFKYALWTVHALNAAWLVGIIFAVIFECTPIQKAWDPTIPGRCDNEDALWLGSGIPSLLIDVLILLLPLPMLWRLQMKLSRKLLLVGVFACGYMVVVVSIGRLVTIAKAGSGLQDDPTYNISQPVFWLGSEIPISIISVSLPSIFSFLRRAYQDGIRALVYRHPHGSRSKLIDSYPTRTDMSRARPDEDMTEMGIAARRSGRANPFTAPSAQSHVIASPDPSYSPWPRGYDTDSRAAGIHVRRDIDIE